VVVQASIVIPACAGIHAKHTRNVIHYFQDVPCHKEMKAISVLQSLKANSALVTGKNNR
jgi:hypothetical protein